jgi:hypothetical protein
MSDQLCQSSSQSIDLKVVIGGIEKMLHTIGHKYIIIEENNIWCINSFLKTSIFLLLFSLFSFISQFP